MRELKHYYWIEIQVDLLLVSKGCVQTGVDPVSNNEIWHCPEGTNIPPLETQ
jgi:hypothetical protein